jgi:hypothetical protein
VQSKIDTFQLTDYDIQIQKDFIEVWMNIEESIRMCEINHGKQTKKKIPIKMEQQ